FRQFALTIAVSTVISAFNSLTLSPALAALLLKKRQKGHFEALPWFAFPPLGAWVGHKFIAARWGRDALAALSVTVPPGRVEAGGGDGGGDHWGAHGGGGGAGAGVGLVLGRPINTLLGWSFRAFNQGFDAATGGYTRSVGGLLRVAPVVLLLYGGLLWLT